MPITLTLALQEINDLLTVLGQLPTQTNVWPLANKIRSQAEQQLKDAQANPEQGAPAPT